jgi:hypothetical protein
MQVTTQQQLKDSKWPAKVAIRFSEAPQDLCIVELGILVLHFAHYLEDVAILQA